MRRILTTLLPIGLAACGSREPGAGPQDGPWFQDVAAASGLAFEHRSGHRERHYMPEIMGGGGGLLDVEGDGDLDVYLVQGAVLGEPRASGSTNRLFRNDGGLRFTDVTEGSGAGDAGYGMGVACADVDEDGDTDIYVTNVGPDALLVNEGGGRFRSNGAAAGAAHPGWGTSAGFLDHDRDGDLDLYVATYLDWSVATEMPCTNTLGIADYCDPQEYGRPARDGFFVNAGDGTFADRSQASGIAAKPGTGLGVGFGDFDDDGWLDVFVANDGMPDFLWTNAGDGTFSDRAALAGCAVDENGIHKAGMGVSVADLEGDGDLDVLVCNLNRESDSLFLNRGGVFTDRTARAGLATTSKPFTRFGLALIDFDCDGALDLYQANGRVNQLARRYADDPYAEPNLVFRGGPAVRFEEVLPRGGTAEPAIATSRAAVCGDLDDDGDVDVVVVNRDAPAALLANEASGGRHRIVLRVLERSGRDALGASVYVEAGGRTLRREVAPAYSYLASNDPRVHAGLGDLARVDAVRVRWVDGEEQSFGPLEADRTHVLRRE